MILLLGGTSDTATIALRMAQGGYRVLVSKATDVPLETGHPSIETRTGPLDDGTLAELIDGRGIRAIVDATHPYAAAIRATAGRVAAAKNIPCLSFVRPTAVDAAEPGVEFAPDHAAAAAAAFRHGRPVLLTTGTRRNLGPYVQQAGRTGLRLIVRVLDRPESLEACRRAGISPQDILAGRGPFSVEENRRQIRAFGIGVLVTKDSGTAGGTAEKLQAAREEGCAVVVVARPAISHPAAFADVDALLRALTERLGGTP